MSQPSLALALSSRQVCRQRSGAVYRDEGYAEIKRLFIAKAHRGCGLARQLIVADERDIVAEGIQCARLKMGIYQP